MDISSGLNELKSNCLRSRKEFDAVDIPFDVAIYAQVKCLGDFESSVRKT